MKLKRSHKIVLLLIGLVLFVVWVECEQRFVVKGRVVDATTGKPIEGASVAISWTGHHFPSFYSSGSYVIENAKTTSNQDGYFEIPKYFFKSSYMGVYEKGHVCWSSNRIFLKGGKGKRRRGFWVKNGMTIQLEPMTSDYPRFKHASFIIAVSSASGGLEGTGEERKFFYDIYWNRKNEQ